jgi:hypothetical protein
MSVHNRRKGVHLVEPIGSGLGGVPFCPVRSADLPGELHDQSRESNELYWSTVDQETAATSRRKTPD